MAKEVRLSLQGLKVLRFFLQDVTAPRFGAEISTMVDVGSGTLYPLLGRLEGAGWLKSEWERGDPARLGRPLLRLYTLTKAGEQKSREALEPFQIPLPPEQRRSK